MPSWPLVDVHPDGQANAWSADPSALLPNLVVVPFHASYLEMLRPWNHSAQYPSEHFQRLLGEYGIVCSVIRRGDCWGNAAMESLFLSLKTERLYLRAYRPRDEARADVFDYIERFYNPRRRHSTLGLLQPRGIRDPRYDSLVC